MAPDKSDIQWDANLFAVASLQKILFPHKYVTNCQPKLCGRFS